MILKYTNPQAKTSEIRIDVAGTAPLVYGQSYSIPDIYAADLLASGDWTKAAEATPPAKPSREHGK